MKIATTEQLCILNDEAITLDLNRHMSTAIYERLDPDGVHLCVFTMLHNEDFATILHYRTQWLVKIVDTDKPAEFFIDIPVDMFNKLTDYNPDPVAA